MKHKAQYIPGALLLALGATPLIAGVTIPHTFQSGDTARAAEVNENFDALRQELAHALDRIDEMQELHEHVEVIADPNYPNDYTVLFEGVNVQIVNGLGETESTNGLGNLIVGYNEPRGGFAPEVCSDGRYDDKTDCTSAGETWARNHKSGSHNIVGGTNNAYASFGGLVVGRENAINRDYATVTGGHRNIASGEVSNVSGGLHNTASGRASHVSGGWDNTASGLESSILGGNNETTSSHYETIPKIP